MGVLKDKQYREYNYFSRYQNVPYYYHSEDRRYIYGTTSHISKDISYTLYDVKSNDTLDTIALDFYNNPTYFWIIADFNNIQDPYKALTVGSTLKVPVFNEVKFEENI